MVAKQGNCFICGRELGKVAMKNHILKEHGEGDEECYLVKAEGAYDKGYWLYFSISLDASLSALDRFLRQIWCECCGHMSAFRRGGAEFGKSRKISALSVGDALLYEYDFGSTTEIIVTALGEISRPKQREKVQLLARNVPPEARCEKCGAPADVINVWEDEILCDACAAGAEDEAALLPIVNSPRCGECGYDGAQDKWTFDPDRVGQSEAHRRANRRARNYVWVRDDENE